MPPLIYAWDIIAKAMVVASVLLVVRLFIDRRRYSENRHFELWARQMQEI